MWNALPVAFKKPTIKTVINEPSKLLSLWCTHFNRSTRWRLLKHRYCLQIVPCDRSKANDRRFPTVQFVPTVFSLIKRFVVQHFVLYRDLTFRATYRCSRGTRSLYAETFEDQSARLEAVNFRSDRETVLKQNQSRVMCKAVSTRTSTKCVSITHATASERCKRNHSLVA